MSYQRKRKRETWEQYFMRLAQHTATRATCNRLHAGAVIVKDNYVLAGGYNGSIRDTPHCEDEGVGCLMMNDHCVRTIHSEANAMIQAARTGVQIEGADIYVTHTPCWTCFKLIANAGIKRIYYGELYDNKDNEITMRFAEKLGIEIIKVD